MDVLNELVAKTMGGIENENLISFMRSFCGDMVQAGEIPERDRPFQEAFQKVYEAALAVEEKTKEFVESDKNLDADDRRNAKKRLGELRSAVDRLQTLARPHPPLALFAGKVVLRAREMSTRLENFSKEEPESDFDTLYDQFIYLKGEK